MWVFFFLKIKDMFEGVVVLTRFVGRGFRSASKAWDKSWMEGERITVSKRSLRLDASTLPAGTEADHRMLQLSP